MGVTYRCWLGVYRGFVGIASDFWRSFTGRRAQKSLDSQVDIDKGYQCFLKLKSVLDQKYWDHTCNICYGGRPLFRGPTIDQYNTLPFLRVIKRKVHMTIIAPVGLTFFIKFRISFLVNCCVCCFCCVRHTVCFQAQKDSERDKV